MALLFQEFLALALRVVCVALGVLGVAVCMVECADDPYDRFDPYSGVTEDLKYEVSAAAPAELRRDKRVMKVDLRIL